MPVENLLERENLRNFTTNFKSPPFVERKTIRSSEEDITQGSFVYGKQRLNSNILNNYRSYTYNFTLFCPTREQLKSTEPIIPTSIIARSGGKGTDNLFSVDESSQVIQRDIVTGEDITFDKNKVESEIKDFNQYSSGRFDLFINNVEMTTLSTGNEQSGNTTLLNVKFSIIEPYSMIGFVEALKAATLSAGYFSISHAVFCLRLEFIGYKDDPGIPTPEVIPGASRDFFIRFSNIDSTVTETGTEYRCEATSGDYEAASNISQSRAPVQATGNTVYEVLESVARQFTENSKNTLKNRFGESIKISNSDEWVIEWVDENGQSIRQPQFQSDIAKSKIGEKMITSNLYSFAKTNADGVELGNPTVIFRKNTNFHDIINAIIRDSDYLPVILQRNTSDPTIPFWGIYLKVEDVKYSDENKRFFKRFTYIIRPKNVLKTQLPGYQNSVISADDVQYLISRDYEYIYSGQNTDIIDLSLKFDQLFYNYGTAGSNNIPVNNKSTAAASGNSTQAQETKEKTPEVRNIQVDDTAPIMDVSQGRRLAVNSTTPKDNQWYILARNLYQQLLEGFSGKSPVVLDMTIIGDPVFLITENFNGDISLTSDAITASGQANISSPVYVTLTFRNPIDFDEKTGRMYFNNNNRTRPFSGVYQILTITHVFEDGQFKSKLTMQKLAGILIDDTKTDIVPAYKPVPNPVDQRVPNEGEQKSKDACRSGTLKDLVSGIGRAVDSIQQAEARIVGAIEGAVSEISEGVSEITNLPAKAISAVTNKINGALQGINNEVTDAANKLGLSPSQLSSLSPKELLTMVAISNALPDKFDLLDLDSKGVCASGDEVNNIPKSQ